jgi:hypothetical protein
MNVASAAASAIVGDRQASCGYQIAALELMIYMNQSRPCPNVPNASTFTESTRMLPALMKSCELN